jgi:hypothetical protein
MADTDHIHERLIPGTWYRYLSEIRTHVLPIRSLVICTVLVDTLYTMPRGFQSVDDLK